jgi:hypothetical protein
MSGLAFQSPPRPSPPSTSPHSTVDSTNNPSHAFSPFAPKLGISQHDYNFSPKTYDESSATEEHNDYTDEERARRNAETASSRSSISSLPASVAPSAMAIPLDAATPTKSPYLHELRVGSLSNDANGRKWRDSPFRNPSSVRSIQMRDEDDVISPPRKRSSRMSRNMSTFSAISSGSITQPKRRSERGSRLSPRIPKEKKDFPLVLLHCSLLPPTMPIRARISDADLLQAVLPQEYWRRWELLTDKIRNDLEIQSRGVLIPHPKADYELLEERLLESLELAKPRLRSGHYYGNETVDETEESGSDAETAVQGTKCQDCGKRVIEDIARDRKWEVKVYAANGLMRAGAWSAAWNEMEKVDIEVSLWLPEDVRREVEERCLDLGIGNQMEADDLHEQQPTDEETRRREVYGSPSHDPQEKINGFFESSHPENDGHSQRFQPRHHFQREAVPTLELKQLFIDCIKVLAQDRRNIAIAILSLVVVFSALSTSAPLPQSIDKHMVPASVLARSSQTIPQCTISSVSAASESPTAGSAPTQREAATSTEQEIPVVSHDLALIELQAFVPVEKQGLIHEVELGAEQTSTTEVC